MNLKKLGNGLKSINEHSQSEEIKDDIQQAYDSVKLVKSKLKKFGKTNKEMSTLKKALRNMVDELEDLEDLDLEGLESSDEDEVSDKNEQSEGYGTWQGLGMEEQVIKLTNKDLNGLFERISTSKYLVTEDRDFVKRQVGRCKNGNAPACFDNDCRFDSCGCVYCCNDNLSPCGKTAGPEPTGNRAEKLSINESQLLLERPTAKQAREGCHAKVGCCCSCYYHGSCDWCEESLAEVGDKVSTDDTVVKDLNTRVIDDIEAAVLESYRLIRKSIIREQNTKLKLRDYGLMNEQSEWGGRNPGVSAASGIENIIDNLEKGFSMLKDSTTRKQIQNTLVKLNNFMMYSAELVGSGSTQRTPRSYDQLANPLPFPELDEPEDLEDIDDELDF